MKSARSWAQSTEDCHHSDLINVIEQECKNAGDITYSVGIEMLNDLTADHQYINDVAAVALESQNIRYPNRVKSIAIAMRHVGDKWGIDMSVPAMESEDNTEEAKGYIAKLKSVLSSGIVKKIKDVISGMSKSLKHTAVGVYNKAIADEMIIKDLYKQIQHSDVDSVDFQITPNLLRLSTGGLLDFGLLSSHMESVKSFTKQSKRLDCNPYNDLPYKVGDRVIDGVVTRLLPRKWITGSLEIHLIPGSVVLAMSKNIDDATFKCKYSKLHFTPLNIKHAYAINNNATSVTIDKHQLDTLSNECLSMLHVMRMGKREWSRQGALVQFKEFESSDDDIAVKVHKFNYLMTVNRAVFISALNITRGIKYVLKSYGKK